jgi:hypothetical protein
MVMSVAYIYIHQPQFKNKKTAFQKREREKGGERERERVACLFVL